MKKFWNKALLTMVIGGSVLFCGCGEAAESNTNSEREEAEIITEYNWKASGDSSLIACEKDGTFKYYQSAEDLTNNYFEGTYEFYMGEAAVIYITTELSDYGIKEEELERVFENSDEYDESNFVCFILHNEACMMDGVNQIEKSYQTPYFGFCVESEGTPCLDIANMNSGNSYFFVAQ